VALERYFWSDFFATGAALRKNLEKEYAETKAVLGELGWSSNSRQVPGQRRTQLAGTNNLS
jgi:hypothetical protein